MLLFNTKKDTNNVIDVLGMPVLVVDRRNFIETVETDVSGVNVDLVKCIRDYICFSCVESRMLTD